MIGSEKLIIIKIIHTAIWMFFILVLAYMFYAAITVNVGTLFWIGLVLIVVECAVLLMFKWTCPLTIVARKYSDSQKDNFDIYLPNWIAKHNKTIYSILFVILVVVYSYNYLS